MLQNLQNVYLKIETAANLTGRKKEDITLIAVSKTKPIEMLEEAYNLGVKVFGENKVQELVEKYEKLQDVHWHLIGTLQKNKVKYIIDKVDLIHSLDNFDLAKEIDKRAKAKGIIANVLIQINIGEEESKSGILKEELNQFIEELKVFENIKVCGLMAIPPKCTGDEVRYYFKQMKILFDNLKTKENSKLIMKYLSMGMTGDYEVAIEEGANMVRVGTGIFGDRDYTK
nr:YggS family pyridoxal phosphate-dependent enzyme [Clostridium cylindrosporum]